MEEGIVEFVQGRGTQQFDLHERETPIHRKLEVQINNIGWNHFMEGKLPILLGNLQKIYFRKENIRTRRKTWMKGLVYTLTRGLLYFWIERNSILHRRDRNG